MCAVLYAASFPSRAAFEAPVVLAVLAFLAVLVSSHSPWRGRDGRAGRSRSPCPECAGCHGVSVNTLVLHLWVDFTFLKHKSF